MDGSRRKPARSIDRTGFDQADLSRASTRLTTNLPERIRRTFEPCKGGYDFAIPRSVQTRSPASSGGSLTSSASSLSQFGYNPPSVSSDQVFTHSVLLELT